MGGKYFIVGTFFGIQLRIDYSWFIIFALIAWDVITVYLPSEKRGLSALYLVLAGLIVTVIIFLSLIAHEYAHSIVANRRGLRVKRITLFLFGGASELQHEPDDAKTELLMAAVGPLTSLIIAGAFALIWLGSKHLGITSLQIVSQPVAAINFILAVFNLLPAYPLDGGRIFRSIIWLRRDFMSATRIATNAGIILSYTMVALGILALLGGNIVGGLWFAIIGFFLGQSARYSYFETLHESILSKVTVDKVLSRDFAAVPAGSTVNDFLNNFVLRYKHYDFLVTDKDDIKGIIEFSRLAKFSRSRPQTVIDDYVEPLTKSLVLKPTDSAAKARRIMRSHNLDILPVMSGQKLAGVVMSRYLEDYVMVHRLQASI